MSKDVSVSIVIATYDRPGALSACLESLLRQEMARPFEILVVDNHPQSGITRPLGARFPAVRWFEEPVAGLSRARNRGIREAAGAVIVTTDDDVVAPPSWLRALTAPLFEDETLSATTGNCLALKTETPAEILFEAYGGLRHGEDPAEFDAGWMRRWRVTLPPLWLVGTTANAAFRASLFRLPAVGWFETALGAGSPAGAWEDLYCFYRILSTGGRIRYLPQAELRHAHRETMEALTRQLTGYRRGETAFLWLVWQRHRDWRTLGQALFWIPQWRLSQLAGELLRRLTGRRRFPLRLLWAEYRAYGQGPAALAAGQKAHD